MSQMTDGSWREEVLTWIERCGSRSVVEPVFFVGRPESARVEMEASGLADVGTRADALLVLLAQWEQPDPPHAWLGRSGTPEVWGTDLTWMAAVDWAFTSAGYERPQFAVVTTHGWVDVRTGLGVSYRRRPKRLAIRRSNTQTAAPT